MNFPGWPRRSVRRALGALSLGTALLAASVSSGTSLKATQEATAPAKAELKVPDEISEESIEAVDAGLAKTLAPYIATLFDVSQGSDARKKAASDLLTQANEISSINPEQEALKRQLLRIVRLVQASVLATEASNVQGTSASHQGQLTAAVIAAKNFLYSIPNGNSWIDYLHLTELQGGIAPAAVYEQVLKNLTPSSVMSPQQQIFAARLELQELKAALEVCLAAESFVGDDAQALADKQSRVDTLLTSLLAYEKQPLVADAEKARTAWRVLRTRYPAAADALRPVVNENYFNHNIHFTVSEDLLSRLIADYRSETGSIADCIMGAWVTGSQTTNVDVDVDIRPSMTTANFDLKVSGNTQSNTRASKSPATVWSNGNHYFWMSRSVTFDGYHIAATSPGFSVDTNTQTVGLATKYDRIPIVRGIVRRIASQKIAESKPQTEALTASRLREEALPKFEAETNTQLSTGNQTLQNTLDSLRRRGVAPDSISARSSNTHIAVSSRTIGVSRIGGSIQPPAALVVHGLAAQIHESALNNAVDALGFQGRDVPEKDFITELEKALSELLQRDIKLSDGKQAAEVAGEDTEPPSIFVFSKSDPIRARFEKGKVILSLRTGIKQEGREEIPEQNITIPVTLSLQGGMIVVEPGNIAVGGGDKARSVQIKRILARRIKRKELSPTVNLQAAGDKMLPVTVSRIDLSDGWLTVEVQ